MQQEQLILAVGNVVQDPNGNQFVIEELLGQGGFGAVYLVRDRYDQQRAFALKEIIDPSETDRSRFIYEAELLKRLYHKALPHVYDVFENEEFKRVYMLMDYVKGRDLEVLLAEQAERRFSLELILVVMAPVVDALMYLHHHVPPIVHRDIKPANIILPPRGEEAVLVDFGLAKEYVLGKTTNVIRHGSPGYAALEQYGHGGTTPRTDIYGLGATVYTLLTGVVPIDPVTRIAESRGFDPLEPVSLIAPDVPGAVARTIQRAMSISVEQRFNTVAEFWQELTAHAELPQEAHSNINIFRPGLVTLKTPLPLAVIEQQRPRVTSASLQNQSRSGATPLTRRRSALLPAVLALVLLMAFGVGIFSFLGKHNSSAATTAHRPPIVATPGLVTHTITPTPTPDVYPTLSSSYAGEIGDLLAKRSTPMYLSNIQQHRGNFTGFFRGLGMTGPLHGTVSPSSQLHFSVSVQGGSSSMDFTGVIKVGGDVQGNFQLLNNNGDPLGDYGPWNIAATT